MTLPEENYQFILQLDANVQPIARRWHDDCFAQNRQFKVVCAYRSQEEQNRLILQGRMTEQDFYDDYQKGWMSKDTLEKGLALFHQSGGIPGRKVTWTLDSMHTHRLALDLQPINTTHMLIAEVATKYGITHPFPVDDPPHYQFDQAKLSFHDQVVNAIVDPYAAMRKLQRLIEMESSAFMKSLLQKRLDEFLAEHPNLSPPTHG